MTKLAKTDEYRIGVISDTHGLLRESVFDAFRGVDMILHAGDVGTPDVLEGLGKVAPVVAVRGNTDGGPFGRKLPVSDVAEVGEAMIYMVHSLDWLDLDPVASGFHAVVSGHSHKPAISQKDGVLYLNPGSAGPRRFDYPISVALLDVKGTSLSPRIVEIEP